MLSVGKVQVFPLSMMNGTETAFILLTAAVIFLQCHVKVHSVTNLFFSSWQAALFVDLDSVVAISFSFPVTEVHFLYACLCWTNEMPL